MASERLKPLDGLVILVVEDEAVFRQQMVAFLSQQGASVDSVENGALAVDYCQSHTPDIVVMDIVMPELDGIGLLEQIGDGPWAIIVVSGKGKYKHLQQALSLGACDYIIKPVVRFDQLTDTILTNLALLPDVKAQQEHAELERHIDALRHDDIESSRLLEQLMPEKTSIIANYLLLYRTQGTTLFPLIRSLDDECFYVAVVDLGLLGHDMTVAAVILNSLIEEAWHNKEVNDDDLALQPANMLNYLNDVISSADLQGSIGMLYGYVEGDKFSYANAGLLDVSAPFTEGVPGMALGMAEKASYNNYWLMIDELGINLRFKNIVGDRINFKILPLGDEVPINPPSSMSL